MVPSNRGMCALSDQAHTRLRHGRLGLGTEAWRRRVVTAPQFHENHVLTETFAFNLLMGRRWPPQTEEVQEAERVCRELNLEELLARMPAGLLRMVSETGWQLSHGERSWLYMARTLLQGAAVVILDESFAALDPDTLFRCLRCALKRADTLPVIAHPFMRRILMWEIRNESWRQDTGKRGSGVCVTSRAKVGTNNLTLQPRPARKSP